MYDGKMLVVCGYTAESYCSVVSALDFSTGLWEDLPSSGDAPLPRSACSVAIWDHKMYVFGGWNGHSSNSDFFVYDLNEGTWSQIEPGLFTPTPRRSHCCIQYRDAMYVWGGFGVEGNCDISIYKFDFSEMAWSVVQATGICPNPRSRARAVRIYDKMVIFGGWDRVDHFDDWWEFSLTDFVWTRRDLKLQHPIGMQ